MRVTADLNTCEGHAMCAAIAPDVFELSPDDQVIVLDHTPDDDLAADVRAAVAACPRQALALVDD
ncbi:ferredoxin [Yinghuangia sp. YIM S10712]|uniref:ferredoxin n=1 Tax=Yinghuangia sp. YIM S10712 TaxID=3436930 RepID=UPI003F52E1D0